jgi:hypothetical protein
VTINDLSSNIEQRTDLAKTPQSYLSVLTENRQQIGTEVWYMINVDNSPMLTGNITLTNNIERKIINNINLPLHSFIKEVNKEASLAI